MEFIKLTWSESGNYMVFCAIIIVTIIIAQLVKNYIQKKITEKTSGHQIDVTSFVFIKHMLVSIIYFLGFGWALLLLPITHTFAHSLLAGAGASTLILGFASQQLFSNLFSGLFLVINRPFKIGDTIEFQGSQGKVAEINLNATLIIDQDGNKIFIPSSIILNDKIKIVNIN
ncbi:MAG: mechanosensitive ion channel [Saprospiraceae bacterium]|nr:mechanosensitive ion channel [Saprospiraceae bacterium]HQV67134.1 mechanosensitive ion channel [Saprospiraceae bacterium]